MDKIQIKKVVIDSGSKPVDLLPDEVQKLVQSSNNDIRKAVRAMFGKISDSRMGIQDVLICLSVSYAMVLNQVKTEAEQAEVRKAFQTILIHTDPEFQTEK
jgi:hypothetical protein